MRMLLIFQLKPANIFYAFLSTFKTKLATKSNILDESFLITGPLYHIKFLYKQTGRNFRIKWR